MNTLLLPKLSNLLLLLATFVLMANNYHPKEVDQGVLYDHHPLNIV